MSKYVDSVVHSNDCDLSIYDLWLSFREELTCGVKRFIPHRFTRSRNRLPYVSPLLKRIMMKTDRLHARKDHRHKTIQHEVEKKLSATYWKRLLPPTNDEDSMGINKRLWSSGRAGVTTSQTSGQLNNQCGQLGDRFKQLFPISFHERCSLRFEAILLNQCNCVFDYIPNHTPSMPPISITTAGIAKLSNTLKPNKTPEPDGLSPMELSS